MATNYPINIDTSTTLPSAADNFTPVRAATVNTLRDAILAIEAAVGVLPGSTYGNVAARITAVENAIVSGGVQFGGDLNGTNTDQTVVSLQGSRLEIGMPSAGEVLTYNGTFWSPTVLAPFPSSLPPDGPAGGGLSGNYPNPEVISIQGVSINSSVPTVGQYLGYNGSQWAPTTPPGAPTTLPPDGPAGGDLTGTYPNPIVARIQGININPATPLSGQVLEYNGSNWAPTTPPSALPPDGAASGDLGGTYPNPSVTKIQGNVVAPGALTSIQDGYVLTWDNTDGYWKPRSTQQTVTFAGDLSGNSTSQKVIALQHFPVSSVAPSDGYVLTWDSVDGYWAAEAPIIFSLTFAGDLSGDDTTQTVKRLQGFPVSSSSPTDGYVLTWDATDGYWLAEELPAVTFAQDLMGSDFEQTVVGLQGYPIAPTQPLDGYVLTWDNTIGFWLPESLPSTDPIVFGGSISPVEIPAVQTAVVWSNSTSDTGQLRIQDASGAITTLGGANVDEYTFGLSNLPAPMGVTTLRDRIDTMFRIDGITYTNVIFSYQMPKTTFGSMARFKGTIQGISGSAIDNNYISAMYDIDFVVVNFPGGTPVAVGASNIPTAVDPTWNDNIVSTLPSLTVTPQNGSLLSFNIANACINSNNTYWQTAIDVTLMQTFE